MNIKVNFSDDTVTVVESLIYAGAFAVASVYVNEELTKIKKRFGIITRLGKLGVSVAVGLHIADFTVGKLKRAVEDWKKSGEKEENDGGSEHSGSET